MIVALRYKTSLGYDVNIMKKNPKLEQYALWTISKIVEPTQEFKEIGTTDKLYLVKTVYPAEFYDGIMEQSSKYAIFAEEALHSSNQNYCTTYQAMRIQPEDIVVKDGVFVGIILQCTDLLEAYMHTSRNVINSGVIFTDGSYIGTNKDQYHQAPGSWHKGMQRLVGPAAEHED